ncbi:hypothetical protein [Arenimonas fontis]|uniref:Metal-dependent phosphohydrolase n=1 Tax=Arenimonas fontis TaxID=2608255 RepID=A0A5B2Z8L2_9GAMM|nr:hypothetical protein [Arenimonas fontis]KAA2284237.1 hypothetical protein F0415_10090 [Arenimonas fontis]
MILGYASLYAADAAERILPDPSSARRLLMDRRPDIPGRIEAVVARATAGEGSPQHADAALLGLARLGLRHGGFGDDPHDYHNEEHVLELAERRLGRVMDHLGETALPAADWLALLLFAACHDLRQRERFDVPGPVGGNEAASIAETFRILDRCGFAPDRDRDLYVALELMIAGSTFDTRPGAHGDGEQVVAAGGALARSLGVWLDAERPDWTGDPAARRGERLARLAADLDTANVGEPFPLLAGSALRLCLERERLAGRPLDKAVSGGPCLDFLGRGQMHYFFELHRFCSREGQQVFGAAKEANAPAVRRVSGQLLARFEEVPPASGQAVVEAFRDLCAREAA